jgi:hypothetical protein
LFFRTTYKNSNKGFIDSHSSMGHPCCNKCNIVANCTTFLLFFLAIPFCNLGNNTFMIARSKQFLILGMFANFQLIPIPFLHIHSNILVKFSCNLLAYKEIPLRKKKFIFPFHLITNLTLVQYVSYNLSINTILPMVVLQPRSLERSNIESYIYIWCTHSMHIDSISTFLVDCKKIDVHVFNIKRSMHIDLSST